MAVFALLLLPAAPVPKIDRERVIGNWLYTTATNGSLVLRLHRDGTFSDGIANAMPYKAGTWRIDQRKIVLKTGEREQESPWLYVQKIEKDRLIALWCSPRTDDWPVTFYRSDTEYFKRRMAFGHLPHRARLQERDRQEHRR